MSPTFTTSALQLTTTQNAVGHARHYLLERLAYEICIDSASPLLISFAIVNSIDQC